MIILGNFLHTVYQLFRPLMNVTGFVAVATRFIYFILFSFIQFYNHIHTVHSSEASFHCLLLIGKKLPARCRVENRTRACHTAGHQRTTN
jgi:hypothetical protein